MMSIREKINQCFHQIQLKRTNTQFHQKKMDFDHLSRL